MLHGLPVDKLGTLTRTAMTVHAREWRYAAATIAVALALAPLALTPPLSARPYVWFLAAVTLSGWLAGVWPALLATAASALVAQRLMFQSAPAWVEGLQFAEFLIVAFFIVALNGRWRRAEASARRERAAREGERARLEAVLRQISTGLVIVEAPSGKMVAHNERARELIGFSTSSGVTVDQYPDALRRSFRRFPDPEQWPIVQSMRTGEGVARTDLELVRTNGERAVVRCDAAPIRDPEGRMVGAIATFDDVTEYIVAEESLRFIAGTSTTLAASLDYDTTLASIVQLAVPRLADWCLLHTVTQEGTPRMTVSHVDPTKKEILGELYAKYPLDAAAAHGYAYVLRTGEAEFVPDVPQGWAQHAREAEQARLLRAIQLASLICVPLRTARGTVGAVTLATGESGRRYGSADLRLAEHFARRVAQALDNARLYRDLEEANRAKTEFLAILAHELRNPLAPMRNAVEIMKLVDDRATAERMRALLERQLAHMTRLVDDLVDLSRITRSKIRLRLEPVDLATVVRRALESNRGLLDERRHALVVHLPEKAIVFSADATRIEQILWNLINNAAKYTPEAGRIEISGTRSDGALRLAVRDNGRGISADLLPHVFDSFQRSDWWGTDAAAGLGIGLTLVKQLTELHGGGVGARSDGPGLGSEFVITLPLNAAARDGGPIPAPTQRPSERKARALVCDDNVNAADTMGALLELWGFEVRVVYDGESAVRAATEQRPDVALLDLALPGIDGYTVAKRLREHAGAAELFLIAVTGYGQDEDRNRSRQVGFNHHLVKPIDPDGLRRLLEERGVHGASSAP